MQLILIKDVPHLGSLGDQVQVKNGYARNYLLPRGMAIEASSKNARQIEHRRKHLDVLRREAILSAQTEAEKVGEIVLELKAKAGANGRLFGSITNRDVQAALAEKGYELDRRSISLATPIKSVGSFSATVKLHSDVKAEIVINVSPIGADGAEVPEEAEADTEAQSKAPQEGGAEPAAPAEGEAPQEGGAEPAAETEGSPGEAETADAAVEPPGDSA